jgi:hypothetical protein
LAVVVVAVYAAVVLGIGRVPTSEQWTLLAFSMLAAAVTALVYQPFAGGSPPSRPCSLAAGAARPTTFSAPSATGLRGRGYSTNCSSSSPSRCGTPSP